MKSIISAAFLFVLCVSTHAQTTVSEWQAKAVEKYPALGVSGSDLNKRFVAEYTARRKTNPTFFNNPSWPLTLADELASPAPQTAPPPKSNGEPITETEAATKIGSTTTFAMRVLSVGLTTDGGVALINKRGLVPGLSVLELTEMAPTPNAPEPAKVFVVTLSAEVIQFLKFKDAAALKSAVIGKRVTITAPIVEHKSDLPLPIPPVPGAKLSEASTVALTIQ